MIAQARRPGRRIACVALFVVFAAGCGTPAVRFDRAAGELGLSRSDADLPMFRKGEFIDGEPIHIYLDGDGTPVSGSGRIALDPTSRDRLILDLIVADPAASVLVGRPCYHGAQRGCDSAMWTTARYSDAVVDPIVRAVNEIAEAYPRSPIWLAGYSGGGALAMLVAPRVQRVSALVTIAGNLDTAAWTQHHGYGPLTQSGNPAAEPPLSPAIRQLHLFGADDTNVPVDVARATLDRQPIGAVEVEVVAGFDHRCCWPGIWAARLRGLSRRANAGATEQN
ncbi:MAG: alpha/beta fold hydrolase [Gammaproteobacteria bacterium]|jgi:dienelactone hydrolase